MTTLTATAASATVGQPVSFHAFVDPPIAGCTGLTLTPVTGANEAICQHTWTSPGSFTIAANYSGDSGSGPSSGTTTLTVTAAPVVSSVSPSAGPIAGGQTVTITGSHLTGATW